MIGSYLNLFSTLLNLGEKLARIKNIHRYLNIFNICVCAESLIRVGYCIYPVIIMSVLGLGLILDLTFNKK